MNTHTATKSLMSQTSTEVLMEAASRLVALTSPSVEESRALAMTLVELMDRKPELRASLVGAL